MAPDDRAHEAGETSVERLPGPALVLFEVGRQLTESQKGVDRDLMVRVLFGHHLRGDRRLSCLALADLAPPSR